MTVSANPTPDFQRDQILTAAIRLCGVLTDGEVPSADQLSQATFHLNMAIQELQACDLVLTSVSRATLALISGTAEYDLPADVIDVELGQDDTIGSIITSGQSAEPIVKTMSRAEWMNIAVKAQPGRPARAYVEKKALTRVVFWPVPDAAYTFRYSSVTLLRGADTGLVTMQTRRAWTSYLMYATASGVAFDNSMSDKGGMFMQIANNKLAACKAGEAQHGAVRLSIGPLRRNW
jgi:hypothetical protein